MCDSVPQKLAKALDKFGQKWELNPGDGAFYGPKASDMCIRQSFFSLYELIFFFYYTLSCLDSSLHYRVIVRHSIVNQSQASCSMTTSENTIFIAVD